jgi:hypothetical protein
MADCPKTKAGSGMANRLILGMVLTIVLTLSPDLAQAGNRGSPSDETQVQGRTPLSAPTNATETYSQSPGVPVTPPLMKVIPQWDRRFSMEAKSHRKTPGRLPRCTWQLTNGPPHSRLSHNRVEPGNFSDLVLTRAYYYLGTPYGSGCSLQTGHATDCSGFVQYIYKNFKVDLPRSSAEQAEVGKVVSRTMDFSKMLPGDLLFFSRRGRQIGHAGIYVGEGRMIHASSRRQSVIITDLRQPYYESTFVIARRVFDEYPQWTIPPRLAFQTCK